MSSAITDEILPQMAQAFHLAIVIGIRGSISPRKWGEKNYAGYSFRREKVNYVYSCLEKKVAKA